jgi:hypothetical protein
LTRTLGSVRGAPGNGRPYRDCCSRWVKRCGRSVFGGRPRVRGGSSMPGASRGASVTFRRCAHGKFSRGRERLVSELSKGVIATFEQLASQRRARAVTAEPLRGLLVVGAVW